jgi:pimeloyl-ACP methyl ester carboxylesterase
VLQILIALIVLVPAVATAEPCTKGTAACTEWVTLGRGPERSLVYRSHPLNGRNEQVTRALVIVHDTARDAAAYFRTAVAAAGLAGAADDTLLISPRFASRSGVGCTDTLAVNEVNWPCEGNSWRSGGEAAGSGLTSFDLADEVLRRIARKSVFPNLRAIVVAGHSAGGQFVTRYGMANRVHETLGIPVSYVVANPSSYAYPGPDRPMTANGRIEFGAFSDRSCGVYDRWPYGLADRTGYAEKTSAAQLRKQLVSRPTTYLLGELDVLPVGAFDASCAAMAQGPTRLARGRAFAAYVNQRLQGTHAITVVPGCGHDPTCMFAAAPALRALFPPR